MERIRIPERSIFGIIVILIGSALLLNATGIIDAHLSFGTFWPVILIIIGIGKMLNDGESIITGIIILGIGVFFQLRNLGVPFIQDISVFKLFWPGIIIFIGLTMIFPKGNNRKGVVNRPETVFYEDEWQDEELSDK